MGSVSVECRFRAFYSVKNSCLSTSSSYRNWQISVTMLWLRGLSAHFSSSHGNPSFSPKTQKQAELRLPVSVRDSICHEQMTVEYQSVYPVLPEYFPHPNRYEAHWIQAHPKNHTSEEHGFSRLWSMPNRQRCRCPGNCSSPRYLRRNTPAERSWPRRGSTLLRC